MEWETIIQTLVVALLGTGGATFVWTAFRSVIAWRDSAEGREDKAVARLEAFEEDCRKQLAWERALSDYWRGRSGLLEYTLRQHGVQAPPLPPMPLRSHTDEQA